MSAESIEFFNLNKLPLHSELNLTKVKKSEISLFAEALIHRQELLKKEGFKGFDASENPVDGMDSSVQIQIEIPYRDLLSVLENGILNQYQTKKTSADTYDPTRRLANELRMIKVKNIIGDDDLIHELLPKYGSIIFTNFNSPSNSSINHYSDFKVILKNRIKKRITWMPDDSMDAFEPWMKDDVTMPMPIETSHSFKYFNKLGYIEAQIWGPILPEDILEIRGLEFLSTVPEIVEAAKKLGIGIYTTGNAISKNGRGETLLEPIKVIQENIEKKVLLKTNETKCIYMNKISVN